MTDQTRFTVTTTSSVDVTADNPADAKSAASNVMRGLRNPRPSARVHMDSSSSSIDVTVVPQPEAPVDVASPQRAYWTSGPGSDREGLMESITLTAARLSAGGMTIDQDGIHFHFEPEPDPEPDVEPESEPQGPTAPVQRGDIAAAMQHISKIAEAFAAGLNSMKAPEVSITLTDDTINRLNEAAATIAAAVTPKAKRRSARQD